MPKEGFITGLPALFAYCLSAYRKQRRICKTFPSTWTTTRSCSFIWHLEGYPITYGTSNADRAPRKPLIKPVLQIRVPYGTNLTTCINPCLIMLKITSKQYEHSPKHPRA